MHKNQVFLSEIPWKKSFTGTIDNNKYLPGQKISKNILPGLQPEKVEKHCLRWFHMKRIVNAALETIPLKKLKNIY